MKLRRDLRCALLTVVLVVSGCATAPDSEPVDSSGSLPAGKAHNAVMEIAESSGAPGSNCALFMTTLERFNKGDLDGVLALLHPDFVFMNVGGEDTPWHGPRMNDADGFLRFMQIAGETTTTEKFEILHQFDAPGRCFTVGVETLRLLHNNRVSEMGIIWETHWEDGRATFLREYYDTKELNDLSLEPPVR